MRPRPEDFFGPDDYVGQDIFAEIDQIVEDQAAWDREFQALPWWRKLIYGVLGQ